MLTYEDFLKCGDDEERRKAFVLTAIKRHESDPRFQYAADAQLYYDGENPTINRYEKIIYDLTGRAHVDMWTANHKIASKIYKRVTNQEVAYLLGNGVRFSEKDTKKRLGKMFDKRVMQAALYARIAGEAYGFWNNDHLEIFRLREYVPLPGEETGLHMAGIRFWRLAQDRPLRVTLFEMDGYTDYIQRKGEDMSILSKKRPYKVIVSRTKAEGEQVIGSGNYDGFPIVPIYANEEHKSSLNGNRNTIDALDIARSGMVNNVSEGALIYWILTNCQGMDDLDDAQFIERLKTMHVAHANGDAGAKAEAHTIEAPVDSSKITIDELKAGLNEDFQSFDYKSASAVAGQTATGILLAQADLDLKCDIEIEPQVTEFIVNILSLAGIDDEPTYNRNRFINKLEETQSLIMQAPYLDDEYITKAILAINGDIDMFDDLMKRKVAENATRLREAERRLKELEGQNGRGNQENSDGNGDSDRAD